VDANLREKHNFDELREEINRQILQAQTDIEMLKKQLEEAKIERRHKEECEAIRRLIAAQPPRSQTLKIISDLEKEIAALDSENTASSRMLELRKKQFALLLHVVCASVQFPNLGLCLYA
jgi:THO complex subunit 7